MMLTIVGCLIVSWLAADFLSGLVHWLEDRYFSSDWPLIGKHIARPNELHHEQPNAFLRQGYWSRNWTTLVPAIFAMAISLALGAPPVVWLTFLFVSQGNEIHAWAHQKGKVSPTVAVLQQIGLLQSPKQHAEHHRTPHDIRYCALSDWLNPVLDTLGVWRSLENGLARLGLNPR